ncbi:MAG: PQQ-binding-like beta-propeller repeat protein [Muribaculaceae bacterium]|nr:PQQ-binding-like beta-propeller repeat protein [Muribaculaceae bacterium]
MQSIYRFILTLIAIISVNIVYGDIRIALLTDTHVNPGAANDVKLREAVAEINNGEFDVVIVSGDLTNTGNDEELINVKGILDNIKKPIYIIPGNHENNWSQSAGSTFIDLFGDDKFMATINNYFIVGMNCGPYMKMGNGHIKRENLIWLDNVLKNSDAEYVISINHYPLNDEMDMCDEYVSILHNYPVIAHLCGHYHQFKHYKAGEIDCLINRALDMKNNDYGYSIIEVVGNSIKQWDKPLNKAPILKNAFEVISKHKPYKSESISFTSNSHLDKVYADNASIFTIPATDNGFIYFGNGLGVVKSVDIKTGKVKWEYQTKGSLFSRPIVTEKYLVIPTTDNRLLWLDKNTGSLIRSYNADGPYVADGLVNNDTIYLGGHNHFTAWDASNIAKLWEVSTDNYCQAAPALDDSNVVFGAWDSKLRSLNARTGELNWDWNETSKRTFFSPGNVVPVITDDKVIIVAPDRYMTAFDKRTGKMIWRNNSHKFRESMGHSADNKVVYAKTMDGEIVAVDATSDSYNELWIVDTEFGYDHAPCIVIENNGIVYAGSIKGEIAAINPATHELLWKSKVGNSEVNGWVVDADGNLYCTLIEGTIWRVK